MLSNFVLQSKPAHLPIREPGPSAAITIWACILISSPILSAVTIIPSSTLSRDVARVLIIIFAPARAASIAICLSKTFLSRTYPDSGKSIVSSLNQTLV